MTTPTDTPSRLRHAQRRLRRAHQAVEEARVATREALAELAQLPPGTASHEYGDTAKLLRALAHGSIDADGLATRCGTAAEGQASTWAPATDDDEYAYLFPAAPGAAQGYTHAEPHRGQV